MLAGQVNSCHAEFVFRVEVPKKQRLVICFIALFANFLPIWCLQHFFYDVQAVVLRGSVQQIMLSMSSSLDRWRMLLDEVLQLRAQIRIVASVMLDQIDDAVDHRLQAVNREKSVFAMLLDLIMPEL